MAVLSEVTAFEAYKNGRLELIGRNHEICARHASQIEVLKATSEIIALEAAGAVPVERYVDRAQTEGFEAFCGLLRRAVAGDLHLARQVGAHAAAATDRVRAVRQDCSAFAAGVRAVAHDLGVDAVRQLRRGDYSTAAMRTSWKGMTTLAAFLIADSYQDRDELPAAREALQTFLFRYAIAAYLLALWWIRNGGIEAVSDERLGNDLLDMQQVALATRYDGILTEDTRMLELHEEALLFLEHFQNATR